MVQRTSNYKINDTTFRVTYGDITQLEADVLVSSDDNHLSMGGLLGGGVAAALLKAGGEVIQKDAHKHLPLTLGDVVVTSAGRLPAKYIFHAVTIDYDRMHFAEAQDIQTVTLRCMQLAEALSVHSIAFPALGTGTAGFPFQSAAEIMIRTIGDYLAGDTLLELVMLTLLARETMSEDEVNLFYERAVALASIATQGRRANALVNELRGIVEQLDEPDLARSIVELQSKLSRAQQVLGEHSTSTQQLDQLEARSGIAEVSRQVVAISLQAQAAITPDNRQAEAKAINTKLSGLWSQLNIHYSNLNKLEVQRAKYGPLDVPLHLDNSLADLKSEIAEKEAQVEEAKRQLDSLTSDKN